MSQTYLVRTTQPDREVARSGPVVDEEDLNEANWLIYQPTFNATCARRTTFGNEAACPFQFPFITGHGRVILESAFGSDTTAELRVHRGGAGAGIR